MNTEQVAFLRHKQNGRCYLIVGTVIDPETGKAVCQLREFFTDEADYCYLSALNETFEIPDLQLN